MSRPVVTWVIDNSPYEGAYFTAHIIAADTVNQKLELRVSQAWLAQRAKLNRRTVRRFIAQAITDGYLEPIGAGPNKTTNYRLNLPNVEHPVPNGTTSTLSTQTPTGWAHVEHGLSTQYTNVEHPDPHTSFSSTSNTRARRVPPTGQGPAAPPIQWVQRCPHCGSLTFDCQCDVAVSDQTSPLRSASERDHLDAPIRDPWTP